MSLTLVKAISFVLLFAFSQAKAAKQLQRELRNLKRLWNLEKELRKVKKQQSFSSALAKSNDDYFVEYEVDDMDEMTVLQDQYNLEHKGPEYCAWPANGIFGRATSCGYTSDMVEVIKEYKHGADMAVLKKGTVLYHAQHTEEAEQKGAPKKGSARDVGIFFVSSEAHLHFHKAKYDYTGKYVVKENIYVLYLFNLKKIFAAKSKTKYVGDDLLASGGYEAARDGVDADAIEGYVGCNECEIFLEWSAVAKLEYGGAEANGFDSFIN